ncbi:hypothetical protein [Mucilaginibacter celer]|uniref:Uncharacterized protein n=1 Tax=Mucilaginibacter celer TaxID=2305508 RepID=A0A494W2A7_9SPHI|nr:hypothetical protein [Mucilaginibacter celer]AYL97688.1 hypothetical protein HYN43_021390 [Mucilaginibacter celer]
MIDNFQTPGDFNVDLLVNNKKIVYHNCHEISQGGPVIGELSIDGHFIPNQLFGGPLLIQKQLIYVPVFVKRFLGNGFKLAVIDTDTFSVTINGNFRSLIFLDKIENGRIYFFEHVEKKRYNSYLLAEI